MSVIYKWRITSTGYPNPEYFWYETDPTLTGGPKEGGIYSSPSYIETYTTNISTDKTTLESTIDYFFYNLSNGGSDITIQLPDPDTITTRNKIFIIRKSDSSVNTITFIGSYLPDVSVTLSDQYHIAKIKSQHDIATDTYYWRTVYNIYELDEFVNSTGENLATIVTNKNTIYKWQFYNKTTKMYDYSWDQTNPSLSLSSDYVLPARPVSQISNYTNSMTDINEEIFGYTFYDLSANGNTLNINLPDPSLFLGKYLFIRKADMTGQINIYNAKDTSNLFYVITMTTQTTKKFKVIQENGYCLWQETDLKTNDGEEQLNMNGFLYHDANIKIGADIRARKLKGLKDVDSEFDRSIIFYDHDNNQLNLTDVMISTDKRIRYVSDPIHDQDVATKFYVDSNLTTSSVNPLADVYAATTGNIDLTYVTDNIYTFTTPPTHIDGILLSDLITSGSPIKRILIKEQSNQVQNGIYTYDGSQLLRTSDFIASTQVSGSIVNVLYGNLNRFQAFICTSPVSADTVGSDNIIFETFSLLNTENFLWTFSYANVVSSILQSKPSIEDQWTLLEFNINYDYNNISTVTLNTSTSLFTINPGKYMIDLQGLFYATGNTVIRLINVTDSTLYDFSIASTPYSIQDPNSIVPILFKTCLNVNGISAKTYKFEYRTTYIGLIYSPNTTVPTENGLSSYSYDPDGPVQGSTSSEPYYTSSGKGYVLNILKIE